MIRFKEKTLREALIRLKEAVEYTPLGVQGIKATAHAEEVLSATESTPESELGGPAEESCYPLLLAWAKGELNQGVEWDDIEIAVELAKEALPGTYEDILQKLQNDD